MKSKKSLCDRDELVRRYGRLLGLTPESTPNLAEITAMEVLEAFAMADSCEFWYGEVGE